MNKSTIEFDRSLLRAIQEASPDALLVVDEQGMVASYNQRFVDLWKLDTEHVRAHTHADGSIAGDKRMYAALALLRDPECFTQRAVELSANPTVKAHGEVELIDGP